MTLAAMPEASRPLALSDAIKPRSGGGLEIVALHPLPRSSRTDSA